MADLDSMSPAAGLQKPDVFGALQALEDKFVEALTLVECLEDSGGDHAPAWVYLLGSTVRGLGSSCDALSNAVREVSASDAKRVNRREGYPSDQIKSSDAGNAALA